MTSRQEAQQRALVAKLSREDLEDYYFRTLEDINTLKVHGRKQEEKIKKMATKLIRLANDRKKLASQVSTVQRSSREVDLEEEIEKQQEVIQQINREKDALKQKLRSSNQQMLLLGKRSPHYHTIQSRTDSRLTNSKPAHSLTDKSSSPLPRRYGHSLLEEARVENEKLRQEILALHEQLARLQNENQKLKSNIDTLNEDHEAEVLMLRQHESIKEKSTVDVNVELIRLQRQMKDKSHALTELESRYRSLHGNYESLRASYDQVLLETEQLKSLLLEEEKRNLSQQSIKHENTRKHSAVQEETIRELQQEIAILKEANEKLTASAFDHEKEVQWRQLERELRVQIAQLEATIKADMQDKNDILNKISNQRETSRNCTELDRIRRENEELRDQLRVYSLAGDDVNAEELREALAIIRKKRHSANQQKRPGFLEDIESKDPETELSELQCLHVDTVHELDKTREMLLMQHKINKDYQIEVENVTYQMQELKMEYEKKLDHLARLLDARSARINKLECQLHDVAYGTKQYKVEFTHDEMEVDCMLNDTIKLERGENLMEINVMKVVLSNDAYATLDDRDASLFVTYTFYDFELVSTPILKLPNLLFDFTAQFTVKVDDILLHYLQKESTVFEVHQAIGIEHRTIASAKLRFNQLLERPQGRLHGSATLIGLNGCNYGSIEYWVRLRVPMDQAIRLYRERVKALGYLSADNAVTKKTLDELDAELKDPKGDNLNQLLFHIIACNHVQGRQKDVQPSVYCVYKFFDFGDHDTVIIPHTNNPEFDDKQNFPVYMNTELDAYLRTEKLHIFVFDDTDPEMTSYLGKATIDLLPLAHDKAICAPFELKRSDGEVNGSIEFAARWQLAYRAPTGVVTDDTYFEEEVSEIKSANGKPPFPPHKLLQPPQHMASTPKPGKRKASYKLLLESPSKDTGPTQVDVPPPLQVKPPDPTRRKSVEKPDADPLVTPFEDGVHRDEGGYVLEDKDEGVVPPQEESLSRDSRRVQFKNETEHHDIIETDQSATSPIENKQEEEGSDLETFISDLEEHTSTRAVPKQTTEVIDDTTAPKALPRTISTKEERAEEELDVTSDTEAKVGDEELFEDRKQRLATEDEVSEIEEDIASASSEKEEVMTTQDNNHEQTTTENQMWKDQYPPTQEQDIPTQDQDLPTQEQDIPTQEQDIPTQEQDIPTQEQDIPTHEQDIPTQKQDIPTQEQKQDIPTQEQDIPTQEQDIPTQEQDIPTQEQDLPTQEQDQDLPTQDPLTQDQDVPTQEQNLIETTTENQMWKDQYPPTQEQDLPTQEQDLPTQEQDIPTQEQDLPTQEQDLSTQEQDLPTQDQDLLTQDPLTQEKDLPTHEHDLPTQEQDLPTQEQSLTIVEEQESDPIRIHINHLILEPDNNVWEDNTVEKMFVEFDFLGSVEETPDGAMKPKNKEEKIIYNYEKTIDVFQPDNHERRDVLSSMLTSGHTSLKMTLVSEPLVDDESAECEEIGSASIDLATILERGRDIINDEVDVEDLRNPGAMIGKLNISVEALAVLKRIKDELRSRLPLPDV